MWLSYKYTNCPLLPWHSCSVVSGTHTNDINADEFIPHYHQTGWWADVLPLIKANLFRPKGKVNMKWIKYTSWRDEEKLGNVKNISLGWAVGITRELVNSCASWDIFHLWFYWSCTHGSTKQAYIRIRIQENRLTNESKTRLSVPRAYGSWGKSIPLDERWGQLPDSTAKNKRTRGRIPEWVSEPGKVTGQSPTALLFFMFFSAVKRLKVRSWKIGRVRCH